MDQYPIEAEIWEKGNKIVLSVELKYFAIKQY